MEDGEEHLGKVLHVLLILLKASGQHVCTLDSLFLVFVRPAPLILLWHRTNRNPVAVTLAFGVESGAHANPILLLIICIISPDNIAKAIVGSHVTFHTTVLVGLRRLTVDNLSKVWHLLDFDIDRSPCRAIGDLGISQRAYIGVAP